MKEWAKRMYVYPQTVIVPGKHFDYDSYWKEKRGSYMGRLGAWQSLRATLAAQVIDSHNGKVVNDIGSGSGEVAVFIKKNSKVKKVIAYDSSPYALEIARSLGLETKQFDINKEGEFAHIEQADFTIMFEILEHIPGPEELLKSAFEKSSIGVLFSFPNTGFFVHRFRLFFFGKFPMQWAKHPAEHIRFWTKKDLLWWMEAQGYKNYTINYYIGIPFLKSVWPNMFAAGFFVTLLK